MFSFGSLLYEMAAGRPRLTAELVDVDADRTLDSWSQEAATEDEIAHYRLGLALEWSGHYGETADAFAAGLEHAQRLPPRWRAILRAAAAGEALDYDTAWAELAPFEDSASDLPDLQHLLGELFTHGVRYIDPRRARRCFERALVADPRRSRRPDASTRPSSC